jgi:RNA polymerase sigma factor (sigma-70 family)
MSITEVYIKYYDLFLQYAKSKLTYYDEDMAKDLIQDVFINVLRYDQKYPGMIEKDKEVNFILSAMHHHWIDRYRVEKNKPVIYSDDQLSMSKCPSYIQEMGLDEPVILSSLHKVDPKAFFIFKKKILEGYTYEELAKDFNQSKITMRVAVSNLRKKALKSKVLVSMLAVLIMVLTLSCNKTDCPPTTICPECPTIGDSSLCPPDIVCPACLEAYKVYTQYYWDSVKQSTIYQVDTMRENFIEWENKRVAELNALLLKTQ